MKELPLSVKNALDAGHSWSLAFPCESLVARRPDALRLSLQDIVSCQQLDCGICVLLDAAQTDSDVLDIAEAHNLDATVCFDYVSRSTAKGRCKACRHVGLFPSMFPCNACLDGKAGDYYEAIE